MSGSARRHPVRAGLWTVTALLALLQLGRLGAHISRNVGISGIVFKLGVLGAPGMTVAPATSPSPGSLS